MALSAADELALKGLVNQSTADDSTKLLLIRIIDLLASKNVVAGDGTVGATGTLGLSVAGTVKNGLVVTLGS